MRAKAEQALVSIDMGILHPHMKYVSLTILLIACSQIAKYWKPPSTPSISEVTNQIDVTALNFMIDG